MPNLKKQVYNMKHLTYRQRNSKSSPVNSITNPGKIGFKGKRKKERKLWQDNIKSMFKIKKSTANISKLNNDSLYSH